MAEETRWRIVRELLGETLNVAEVARRVGITNYNASKHLRILREAGIIRTQKLGKELQCSVEKSFRLKVSKKRRMIDLGCCSFRFP